MTTPEFGWVLDRCSSGAKPGMPKARKANQAIASSIQLPEPACRQFPRSRCSNAFARVSRENVPIALSAVKLTYP